MYGIHSDDFEITIQEIKAVLPVEYHRVVIDILLKNSTPCL